MSIIFLFFFVTFSPNLDYPKDANDIEKVELTRPDKASKGKFAKVQALSSKEIKMLLFVLGNAQPLESKRFTPNYYIVFTTKKNETKKIMINKDKVKGYDNDMVYQIRPLEILLEF